VRIAFDRERLYLGVICYDSDPSGIRGQQMLAMRTRKRRPVHVVDRHYLDGRTGYYFETNRSA